MDIDFLYVSKFTVKFLKSFQKKKKKPYNELLNRLPIPCIDGTSVRKGTLMIFENF